MKMPTIKEIKSARKKVNFPTLKQVGDTMTAWEGGGWHEDEILFGILIGLKIAENRAGMKE